MKQQFTFRKYLLFVALFSEVQPPRTSSAETCFSIMILFHDIFLWKIYVNDGTYDIHMQEVRFLSSKMGFAKVWPLWISMEVATIQLPHCILIQISPVVRSDSISVLTSSSFQKTSADVPFPVQCRKFLIMELTAELKMVSFTERYLSNLNNYPLFVEKRRDWMN